MAGLAMMHLDTTIESDDEKSFSNFPQKTNEKYISDEISFLELGHDTNKIFIRFIWMFLEELLSRDLILSLGYALFTQFLSVYLDHWMFDGFWNASFENFDDMTLLNKIDIRLTLNDFSGALFALLDKFGCFKNMSDVKDSIPALIEKHQWSIF